MIDIGIRRCQPITIPFTHPSFTICHSHRLSSSSGVSGHQAFLYGVASPQDPNLVSTPDNPETCVSHMPQLVLPTRTFMLQHECKSGCMSETLLHLAARVEL
jgi:hypothetical protein